MFTHKIGLIIRQIETFFKLKKIINCNFFSQKIEDHIRKQIMILKSWREFCIFSA